MSWTIKSILFALAAAWVTGGPVAAAEPSLSADSNEQLIADLAHVHAYAPGMDGMAMVGGFMGNDHPPTFEGGVLGSPPPIVAPPMRELVKRGTAALPALLDHLSDARPTDLVVGGGDFHYMFMEYGDEYDSRHHHAPDFADELSNDALQGFRADTSHPTEKYFHEPYVLKVGDVCYALIGQIVDRQLVAARYQPTAGLVVNSPIVMPGLADRVRKDWSGLDAQAHRDGLIEDAKTVYGYEAVAAALVRLRFYYPQDYALQKSGDLGKAIAKFEQDEKSRKR